MKQCPTCQEEFADKFGFCPVDGTALAARVAPVSAAVAANESVVTAANSSSNGPAPSDAFRQQGAEEFIPAPPAPDRGEYHLTFLEDEGLTHRLLKELKGAAHEAELTWPEFKRDPVGFTKRTAYASGALVKKFFRQDYATQAVVTPLCVALLIGGGWYVAAHTDKCFFARLVGMRCIPRLENPNENLELVQMIDPDNPIPKEQEKPDKGPAGTETGKGGGSKPKQDAAHGGGGGGRQEELPPSAGKLPTATLQPPILTANPKPPAITNPHLPVEPTMQVDPMLVKVDPRDIPYGLPNSTATVPSSGPGSGGGMGTGSGGGMGSGDGTGLGPGRGYNTGGGDAHEGGGGKGGGGGGDVDYSRPFNQRDVTRKAVITFKPEPGFTEDARKNNVTGVVRLRAILSAGGGVTGISVVKGLPDGLTEKAIAAARQIRFTPAEKDGHAVSQYIVLEYNFNIY
jgi:TonB family protein